MQTRSIKDAWGPEITRASHDERWVIDELMERTPSPWRWIKNPENVSFDLICVQDLIDIINPIALVEVEGTPLQPDRPDIWTGGNRFPPLWRLGLTIPKRKIDDYMMPWLRQYPRGRAYYLKCNNSHNEAFVLNIVNCYDGKVVEIRNDATPNHLRQHDLARKNLMLAMPLYLGMFGVPYVFDFIIDDLGKLLTTRGPE